MSRREVSRKSRRTADELSDAHIRRMLRPGDRDRERQQRKALADGLRALFATFGRHPFWTMLGVLVSVIATLWQVLPRDKNSELLDALTRREHELLDQRARTATPGENALIDADLEQVRRKVSEVIDRMSSDEDPTSTPEQDHTLARDIGDVAEGECVAEGSAREPDDGNRDAPSLGIPAGAQHVPRSDAPMDGGQGDGGEGPVDRSGGGPFPKAKISTRAAPHAPVDGPVVPEAPDEPLGPAVPQRETWIHDGVLRLTLETNPLRGERPRDILRRHRELVSELQRWLPSE